MRKHEGYLSIDHRFSPGVPEDIARKAGLDPKHMGEGKHLEEATLHCAHCLGSVVKNRYRVRERGYCMKCDAYICDGCHAKTKAPEYQHASGHQIMDAAGDLAQKGTVLGSPSELLYTPKIFIP